jgi:hypothetical protein
MDSHSFLKLDPDLHSHKKLDPDPLKVYTHPKHWLRVVAKVGDEVYGSSLIVAAEMRCKIRMLVLYLPHTGGDGQHCGWVRVRVERLIA